MDGRLGKENLIDGGIEIHADTNFDSNFDSKNESYRLKTINNSFNSPLCPVWPKPESSMLTQSTPNHDRNPSTSQDPSVIYDFVPVRVPGYSYDLSYYGPRHSTGWLILSQNETLKWFSRVNHPFYFLMAVGAEKYYYFNLMTAYYFNFVLVRSLSELEMDLNIPFRENSIVQQVS